MLSKLCISWLIRTSFHSTFESMWRQGTKHVIVYPHKAFQMSYRMLFIHFAYMRPYLSYASVNSRFFFVSCRTTGLHEVHHFKSSHLLCKQQSISSSRDSCMYCWHIAFELHLVIPSTHALPKLGEHFFFPWLPFQTFHCHEFHIVQRLNPDFHSCDGGFEALYGGHVTVRDNN